MYPQRKSPRLQGYDYSTEGAYLVTICTHERIHHFGKIVNDEMKLSETGQVASHCWSLLPHHFAQIDIDLWVMMPNHIHGIVVINYTLRSDDVAEPSVQKPISLGTVMNSYKGAVTRAVNRAGAKKQDRFWQTRYHDHIIRDEKTLNFVRAYVLNNPAQWQKDTLFSEK